MTYNYITNIINVLLGRNPFQLQLDDLRDKYAEAGKNVESLRDMYCKALEMLSDAEGRREAAESRLKAVEKDRLAVTQDDMSLQTLVENLRERIREKDAELAQQGREYRERIEQMKQDYQERIRQYNIEMDHLRNHPIQTEEATTL